MSPPDPNDLARSVSRLEGEVADLRARLLALEATRAPVAPVQVEQPAHDLETHLGTYWLPRAGILALITGIAFLVVYRFRDLGVTTAIVLGYAVGAALAAGGVALRRRHSVLGQVLVGGGLAVAYFVTFALHFVPAVRVIQSQPLALGLLAAVVVGIIAVASRLQSETVAGIALFLGLHTGFVSDIGTFTFLSSLLLASGALYFLVRHQWVIVPLSSLVAVYATHLVWWIDRDALAPGSTGGDLATSLGFLAAYHLLFTLALVLRPAALSPRVLLAFPSLNCLGAGALGVAGVLSQGSSAVAALLAVLAAMQLLAGVAAWREGASRELARTYFAFGGLTVFLAMPAEWTGNPLALGWLVLAAVLVLAGERTRAPSLRSLGAVGVVAAAVVVGFASSHALWLVAIAGGAIGIERMPREESDDPSTTLLRALAAISAGGLLLRLGAHLVPAQFVTSSWVLAAFALFGVGFVLRGAWYRYAALGALAFALARLFFLDLAGLSPDARIVTFLVLGTLLLIVSYVYSRVRHRRELRGPVE